MCTPPSLLRPGGHRATRLYLNLGVVHHRQHLQGEGLGIYNFMSRSVIVIVIVIIVILVILIPLWTLFPIRFRQSIWNIRIIYIYINIKYKYSVFEGIRRHLSHDFRFNVLESSPVIIPQS